jgi:site-specific recombinase XerD
MITKKAFIIKKHGIESLYWAFFQKDGEIDITPTVLFAKMCEADRKRTWEESTIEQYASIVAMFFETMRKYQTSLQTITTKETQGFMQGLYMKELPFQQKDGQPLSIERMNSVETVLTDLVEKATQFGFREDRNLSFRYKEMPGSHGKLDDADRIYQCYIPPELLEDLIQHLEVKGDFERERDEIALRIGYGIGARSEELVRNNNLSIKRFEKARLTWVFGQEIDLNSIIGKGSKGGKARDLIIKPLLASQIFEFLDKHEAIYKKSEHLFCHASGIKLSKRHGTNIFRYAKNNLNHHELNNKSFQKLRHSYATNMAIFCRKNGINSRLIQDRLGHASLATTLIYIEVVCLLEGDNNKAEEMRMVRHENRDKNKKREFKDG